MIVDAGGGTVDLSTYSFSSITPVTAEEIAAPGCEFMDSILVAAIY